MALLWTDGQIVESEAPILTAADRGVTLGDGVFDTALVIGGRVFLREAHLDRLAAALETLAIPLPRSALETAMDALGQRIAEGSVRLTVTRGPAPRGLGLPAEPRPTLFGTAAPLAPAAMFKPLTLAATAIRRNETSPLSRLKVPAYLDAILANREAQAAGADEALFSNTAGRLASTALGNIFLRDEETLRTPPLSDGVLQGIMRGWVLDNATSVGFTPFQTSLDERAAHDAALFVTNSLRLIAPARFVGHGAQAPCTRLRALAERLCAAIEAECGKDPRALGAHLF